MWRRSSHGSSVILRRFTQLSLQRRRQTSSDRSMTARSRRERVCCPHEILRRLDPSGCWVRDLRNITVSDAIGRQPHLGGEERGLEKLQSSAKEKGWTLQIECAARPSHRSSAVAV